MQASVNGAVKVGPAAVFGSSLPSESSGVYDINHVCGDKAHVFHSIAPTLQASCNSEGWMVILKRDINVSPWVNFTRSWDEYKHGFGDLNTEFWYGLDKIHCLTTRQQTDLQILLHYDNGSEHVFTYEHFVVDAAEDRFTLHIGQLQQPPPGRDGMTDLDGLPFTTSDRDNSASGYGSCTDTA